MTAASFYKGVVRHERFGRVSHRLNYRIAYVLIDLDALNEGRSPTRLFGFNAPGLLSVLARDHANGETDDLAQWIRVYLRENGVREAAATIELLTLPRILGFVFNPVSFYFVRDAAGALHHVLCEVNNTFGGRHFYLLRVALDAHPVRQGQSKEFYVSPFLELSGQYFFNISPPGDKLSIGVEYHRADGERELRAHISGTKAPLDTPTCLKILFGLPFMTLGVVFAIHWEAFLLWVKGAAFHSNPKGRIAVDRPLSSPETN